MSTLHLPKSWESMHFSQQQYYLVDTHQAKNLSVAAKIITKRTDAKLKTTVTAAINARQPTNCRRPYWYEKD